jgi:glycogen debranching enzyme
LVLADNGTFIVTQWNGDILDDERGLGLYRSDMRHLSRFELVPCGWTAELMSASADRNYVATIQLSNGAFLDTRGQTVLPHTISLRRNRVVAGSFVERIGLQNYNPFPVETALELCVAADFRDMFDIRGFARGRRGTMLPPELGEQVVLRYQGADGIERRTRLSFDRPPVEMAVEESASPPSHPTVRYPDQSAPAPPFTEPTLTVRIRFAFRLEPGSPQWVTVTVQPESDSFRPPAPAIETAVRELSASYGAWEASGTLVVTDNDPFNRLLSRSILDLRVLIQETPLGLFPYAGIPWFAAPFGRDSLITAFQTLAFQPAIAKGTLRFLAHFQGERVDPWREEEPGKIIHEMRFGEKANLGETPHTRYYGSVDSTPLFLILYAETLAWTGDTALRDELWPNVQRALEWIDCYGDRDGDGYVEYAASRSEGGLRNQGWKDSEDSIAHADGSLAEGPIALVEVQAYVVDAKRRIAAIAEERGDHALAARLRTEADTLAERIRRDFLIGPGEYAIALDGAKQPVRAIASNMGHLLFGGVLPPAEAAHCVERLLARDLDSGWGIRTLSRHHPRYNPMSYHNGSVWPHDNSLIAFGMKRAGFDEAANRIATGIVEASQHFHRQRLPELFCGFQRDQRYFSAPAEYPVSCAPQAWAAGSTLLLLRTILGITPLPNGVRLRPRLPLWLQEVRVSGLRIGQASLDFAVNAQNQVTINALRGGLAISIE